VRDREAPDLRDTQQYEQRTDPSVPAVDIADLEKWPREQLIEFADAELGVDNAAALPKQELIFRVLQRQAERNGTI
jgi:hypothetical protein